MPRHHYLPAAYLGNFSNETGTSLRKKHLQGKNLQTDQIFYTKVENLGCQGNLYSNIVDSIWSDYEKFLIPAIQSLISGTLTAVTWARVLVPFVTAILVRGPEFESRFEERLGPLKEFPMSTDNSDKARIMELQRLLAPILAAEWILMRTEGNEKLIINDNGYIPYFDAQLNQAGYALPVTPNYILGIIPNLQRPIAYNEKDCWFPIIRNVNLDPNNHLSFNKSSTDFARRFIFGSSEDLLSRYSRDRKLTPQNMPEPAQVGFISGVTAVEHEFTWHKFVSAIETAPRADDPMLFEFNFEILKNGWHPPMIFPVNLPKFIPGLEREIMSY